MFIPTRVFDIVKDSPLCQRRPFGIANNVGNSGTFVIQFSRIVDILVNLKERIKERVKNLGIGEDWEFPRVRTLFQILSDGPL